MRYYFEQRTSKKFLGRFLKQDNHCDDNKQRHQTHKREKQFISSHPAHIIGKPTKHSIESQKQKVVGKNRETGALFGLFQLIDKGFHSFMITRRKSNRRSLPLNER